MKSDFALVPFAKNTAPPVKVRGEIERQNNQLAIAYRLMSNEMLIPKPANLPLRQFDLWEHTCCELFLGVKDSPQYWEFNLSPAGHWNVFRMSDYRQNLAEEMAFETLPFQVCDRADYLEITLNIDLARIIPPKQHLEVGITAVIEDRQNQLSYWALTHPGKAADFHLRSSFAIAL